MAKDKSKKKDTAPVEEPKKKSKKAAEPETSKSSKKSKAAPEKASKKSKSSGADEEFAKPSEAPATSDGWDFEDDEHIGDLFLITPLREEEHDDSFNPGEKKKHIVADIVHINEKKPAKSELHEDAWVFGGWSRGSLRGFIGESRVVVRLNRDPSKKKGNNIPWVLLDPEESDYDKVREYLASIDPFKQKAKK